MTQREQESVYSGDTSEWPWLGQMQVAYKYQCGKREFYDVSIVTEHRKSQISTPFKYIGGNIR